jgi:hypothetical protein
VTRVDDFCTVARSPSEAAQRGQTSPGEDDGHDRHRHALELSYLHSRHVTYATICQGPYTESARYRDFMDWQMPWYSLRESAENLLNDLSGSRKA